MQTITIAPDPTNGTAFTLDPMTRTARRVPRIAVPLTANIVFQTNGGNVFVRGRTGGPPLGGAAGDLTAGPASDKGTGYVVATERADSDSQTLWAATRRGRVFVSKNAGAAAAAVTFKRIDASAQPRRFVSGISIDPTNPNHAYISFSGYNAYTPTTPGHVFEVLFNPGSGTAVWTDLSKNLGDQPITSIAFDPFTGDLFASTDYGVLMLSRGGNAWSPAAPSLPAVAVYGLTIDADSRLLYAATHGRGIWRLKLEDSDDVTTGGQHD